MGGCTKKNVIEVYTDANPTMACVAIEKKEET